MHKLISGCLSASVLLVLGATAQASPSSDRSLAAMDSSKPIVVAQAPAGAPSAAPGGAAAGGMPSSEDIGKMKKRAASKKRPSKSEMEKIKQHVPPEYHQYLNFR